jgi:hypothetical protein
MSTYVNVTETEMNSFLSVRGFQRIIIPGTTELTYAKGVTLNNIKYSLRIYSGINPDGNSRGKGQDAIRVCLFIAPACPQCDLLMTLSLQLGGEKVWACTCGNVSNFNALKPRVIGSFKRVHRVYGWRKNLEDRLSNWQDMIGPLCPSCRNPMIMRSARGNAKNKFWGCCNFPRCRGTRSIQKDE